MSSILIVPAEFVPDLRSGLFGEWGFAAEDLATLALQFASDAPTRVYREPLELFDASRALLDLIGWEREQSQGEVCVDLGAHQLYATIVIKALMNERAALVDRLDEMPRRTNEYVRRMMHQRIGVLGDLIAAADDKTETLRPPPPRTQRHASPRRRSSRHRARRR